MSEANVEMFVKGIEAFNRGDIPGVLRFMDPEIQFRHRLAALQGDYEGLEGVRSFLADLAEHFAIGRIDCHDVRDLGDTVLALGTLHATGHESGVHTEQPFAVVARYRDGRMTHFTDFGDEDRALAAAGLEE